jgi:GNAT superfamily N-acetyltransferase
MPVPSNHADEPATYFIRPAALSDMKSLRDVFRRASLANADDHDLLRSHPEFLELSDEGVREGRTRVAVDVDVDATLLGFASFILRDHLLEVEDLFVDPTKWRQGIGTALMLDMVAIAERGGCERLEVTGNPHALSFYKYSGFTVSHEVATDLYPALRLYRLLP